MRSFKRLNINNKSQHSRPVFSLLLDIIKYLTGVEMFEPEKKVNKGNKFGFGKDLKLKFKR